MVTLKEIAQRCQVSTSTVSNIINGKPKVSEETRQRVLQVIEETGYQPNYFAQGMRKQKTKIIGIIVEELTLFSSPKIVGGIMSCAEKNGYRTILENLRLYEKWGGLWYDGTKKYHSVLDPAIKEMLSIKVDGIIYVSGHARNISCFPENFKLPGVVAYGYSSEPKFTSVVIDDEQGGYDATRYLTTHGHEKIGVIAGMSNNIHTMKRLAGYQAALSDLNIPYNPKYVYYCDWNPYKAYEAAEMLIQAGVTAIFCMNDEMVVGVYNYLEKVNLIPGKDIAVIGYDNREFTSYIKPKITTMEIPLNQIGENAAMTMIQMIENPEENPVRDPIRCVECNLVVRDSVNDV